jgi:hypothetical protein
MAEERCASQQPPASIQGTAYQYGVLSFRLVNAGKRTVQAIRRLEAEAQRTCIECGARGQARLYEAREVPPLCDDDFRLYVRELEHPSEALRISADKSPDDLPQHWRTGADAGHYRSYYDRDASPD